MYSAYVRMIVSMVGSQSGSGISREQLQSEIYRVFSDYPHVDASAVMFEPNAFDGKDADYIDTAYGTKLTGRISYYFFKYNRDISWQSGIEDIPEADFVQEYYTLPLEKKVPVVTDPYLYVVTHGSYHMITISVPLFDQNGMANGVLTSDIFLDKLFNRLESKKNYKTSYMVLINNFGTIIYSPIAEYIGKKAIDAGIAYTSSEGINFSYENSIINGKKNLVATQLIQLPYVDQTYTFAFAAPLNEINGSINSLVYPLTAILVITMILLMSAIYFFLSRLSHLVTIRTHELEEQTQATVAASKAKTEFLATMSHEMRTPMNAVIGFSEMLLSDKDILNKRVIDCKDQLTKVHSAGLTLLSIINDILDISKIESGKFEIIPDNYDVPSFINDTVALNINRIEDKPIKFYLDIDENLPSKLFGDELRLKQICNNLLSNAFKYTKEGMVVWRICCEHGADDNDAIMSIIVRDTGKGVREEDYDKLFMDFSQLDAKSNHHIEGTGLGLPLTKKMVELMGGSISVESEYGKGSAFIISIHQKFVSPEIIGPKVLKELQSLNYASDKRLSGSNLKKIQLPYARVLIVDDVRVNLEVAKGFMKPYGMQIDCVTSGAGAVNAIRNEKVRYSAVFMDHMMPEMDGIEATRIIREEIGTEYAKNVPIIILTANALVGNEEMFLSQGFQAFLSKPIDTVRLDSIIRRWVRDKNMEKSLDEEPFE